MIEGQKHILKRVLEENQTGWKLRHSQGSLTLQDRNHFKYLLTENEFYQKFIEQVQDADVVADVGGFQGFYTLLAATHGCQTTCFELDPGNANTIRENIELNPDADVELVEKPVWSKEESLDLKLDEGGKSSVQGKDGQVEAVTLDSYFSSREALDLVKIDVEGAEGHVLLGSEQILRDHRPALMIEWHVGERLRNYGHTKKAVELYLKGLGYQKSWEQQRKGEVHSLYE